MEIELFIAKGIIDCFLISTSLSLAKELSCNEG